VVKRRWLIVSQHQSAHTCSPVYCALRAACNVEGILRIALIGSLATDKPNPKDADLLITIRDGTDLAPLAMLLAECSPV